MTSNAKSMPAPRWKAAAWLSAPACAITPDVACELRMGMFRRLETVLASAPTTAVIAILAASRHPTPAFLTWAVLDFALLFIRVPIVFTILQRVKRGHSCVFGSCATDLFILTGTLWSAVIGFGAFVTISSADSSLLILVSFVCAAVIAVQSMRNPSSPRMNRVQMSLILLPLALGALRSPLELVPWGFVLWPIYLAAMSNMTGQIHADHVAMIMAQFENRQLALHCSLTGLPNRSFFDESLGAALRDAATSHSQLSVLCIDLDGFKQVNDRFGHPLGDALLIQVAQRLKGLIRPNEMAARLGGDEFAVLLRTGDRADAEHLAARINGAIAEPFALRADVIVTISASVGIMGLETDGDAHLVDASSLMTRADQALYAAKRAGKGTFRHFDGWKNAGTDAKAA